MKAYFEGRLSFLLYIFLLYDIFKLVMIMREDILEKKIKGATLKRDYSLAKEKILKEYTKMFSKMLKYKKVKIDKSWYFHDYISNVKKEYGTYYASDLDELMEVLYSNKYDEKRQITWLIENAELFNDYNL